MEKKTNSVELYSKVTDLPREQLEERRSDLGEHMMFVSWIFISDGM